jgi:hypothetical protein
MDDEIKSVFGALNTLGPLYNVGGCVNAFLEGFSVPFTEQIHFPFFLIRWPFEGKGPQYRKFAPLS